MHFGQTAGYRRLVWIDGVLVAAEAVHASAVEELHPTSELSQNYTVLYYSVSLL